MYVIERSGVTWNERFYAGTTTLFPWSMWGDLERAYKFQNKSQAVLAGYSLDREGFYTTIEEYNEFE